MVILEKCQAFIERKLRRDLLVVHSSSKKPMAAVESLAGRLCVDGGTPGFGCVIHRTIPVHNYAQKNELFSVYSYAQGRHGILCISIHRT